MAFNKLQDTWLMKFNSMAEILSLKLILNLDPVRGRGYGQLGHFAKYIELLCLPIGSLEIELAFNIDWK